MKKGKKILILVSVACILLGAAMVTGAFLSLTQDAAGQLAALEFVSKTHTVTEPFTMLNIRTINSTVELLPSPDGICRIVCDDSEKLYHQFSITESAQGAQLNINQRDEWAWYEMLDSLYREDGITLQVYLPESEYELVHVYSVSGDIKIAPDFCFNTVNTCTTSGNTELTDLSAIHLMVHSTSGDLILRNIEAEEDVYLECISGTMQVENLKAVNITTHSSSGDTVLKRISSAYLLSRSVSGQIQVHDGQISGTSSFETTSGDVEIMNSDCGEQAVETTSGTVTLENVRGSSLNTRTSSGAISVMKTRYSGNALFHTVSGDILFTGMDANNLELLTSSGDISGDLLTPKNFIVETTSGHTDVPPSDVSAGTCHIHTVSGNISITVAS